MQVSPEVLYVAAALSCAAAGAVFDIKSRRVPNALTAPAFVFGLLLHLSMGGWRQMGSAFAAGLICGVIFLIFYLAGGMGAGDVKLIAAVGCIAGLPRVAPLLIATALAGGVMAIVMILHRGRVRETMANVTDLVAHHSRKGLQPHPELNVKNANSNSMRLPYAVAIAAGSAFTMFLVIV